MIHSNLKLLLLTTTFWRKAYNMELYTDVVTLDFIRSLMKTKTLFPHIQKH